ncbi:TATA-binding protein-associated factor 172 isoform X2 [Pectinophora gossypiella]|uniref:TATA-binding protein-associated factor 172 isoform X2 n=1 Tax=Pectinophora gossypiella TaxID=13191 RepID=UPI00214E29B8|nr:TATA-binding protein-associated factor 172 isoform X2 [Pectinophora gossypiella]
MTSRLDRLFVLLEAGAGPATRRAAARQLGEIQKAHPEELHRLLGRLMKHLRSPAWETRIAASQAVEAILSNVPEWHPSPLVTAKEKSEEDVSRLRCETFDIERVLRHGAHLMGSEGREYDFDEEAVPAADMKERLAKQRQQLNARLGLDVACKLGVDLTSMYSNEDLCPVKVQPVKIEMPRRPVQELVQVTSSKPLSSREMNLAKRKARQALCKQKSRDCSEEPPTPPAEPDRKKMRFDPPEDFSVECSAPVPDCSGAWGESARWPLESWCGALEAQLFSAAWEARHGAASALRELLRARVVNTAGYQANMTREQNEDAHQEWLEDVALRLLCVLALDRFGDFVSDQVVAPVRETCAQTLGVALAHMRAGRVRAVAALLAALARQPQWEARHGALLGFKYLLAARQDVACETGALEHLINGLGDTAEDVSAVAAGALAPAAAALAQARPAALPHVVARLWQLLHEQDELAAPANSYMALLASLMALPQAAKLLHPIDLTDVLPRLWPYLDHSTSSVRKATLQTLRTLTRPLVLEPTQTHTNGNTEDDKAVKSEVKDNQSENVVKSEIKDSQSENVVKSEIKDSQSENVVKSEIKDSQSENVVKSEVNDSQSGINVVKSEEDNVKIEEDVKIEANSATNAVSESKSEVNDGKSEVKDVKCDIKSEVNGLADKYLNWTPELLQEAMRHVYQRILFEHVHEIQEIALQVWENFLQHAPLSTILVCACPMLATWLCLAMQPARMYVDPGLLLHAPPKERRVRTNSQSCLEGEIPPEGRPSQKWYVGGSESQPAAARDRNVMRARCLAAQVLGHLSCYLVQPAPGIEYKLEDESPIDCYVKVMVVYLRSGSGLQRTVASLVVAMWARHTREARLYPPDIHPRSPQEDDNDISKLAPPLLITTIHTALNQALYYDEVALTCNRILQEARDLHAMMKHYKLPVDGEEFNNIIRLEQVVHLTSVTQPMVASMKSKRVSSTLEERRSALQAAVTQAATDQNTLNVSVQAALAGACANLHCLPEKLNPVVRPLMESIKKEPSEELQSNSADTLATLLHQLASREPCPNNKVLVNLKAFLRCDPEYTPRVSLENTEENGESASDSGNEGNSATAVHGPTLDKYRGILTLWEQQRVAERGAPRRGRPPAALQPPPDAALLEDDSRKLLRIQRRGATLALTSLTKYFGDQLPEKLPKLWEFITEPFAKVMSDSELESMQQERAEELISCLQVVEVVAPHVAAALWPALRGGAGAGARLARAPHTALRHMAARALAALAAREPAPLMRALLLELVPALSDVRHDRMRCGAAETLSRVVDALQLQVVPYIVMLVVPLLGRMSDHCEAVRVMSTRCFASLIQLMPLDGNITEPPGLTPDMKARRARDKLFLEQLFNPKMIKDYKIPVPVSAELRSYQQAGVNWLRFLYEYKLHGVLCDDMGLGKTLQSIVVVAGSHYERQQSRQPALPSLVVCPPTLTGHWVFEVNKFIPSQYLKPLQYVGPPIERERLRTQVKYYNLIVASYDIVRKDIDFFTKIKWNYCILDEGHVIKNGKTKAFKAIKQLVANHRLILSGTPIQNNVLELWSLFDFLMPGLLGTERQFTARYSRPILAARDARASSHHAQAGALALEALHRQVLPFLLRRVKEDVLKELPPKITQDYYCELSALQRRLYEHLSREHMPSGLGDNSHTHVFQALHYLQNVCNHPKLVLTADHPETPKVQQQLLAQNSSLDDIEHSAKLPALKQLLLDCGIGTTPSENEAEVVVSQHRALIFCQLKKMLDIVEKDLLQRHLPAVSYLRLDGSVPPAQRHAIVTRFNSDVSIDLLLLTTQVGGLGLNLTGADTVIFVEHDWNPMKDLQAMDRAHRIGQKKVVNVYRLITRDTLEEKIMGLQKFKLMTANTVISSENAAMETMGTEQLLDLFQLSSSGGPSGSQPGPAPKSLLDALPDALPDLWDDKQYEEEYDMTNFIKGLNKMNG